MFRALIVLCVSLSAFAGQRERKLYVGSNSTETTMSFNYQVEIRSNSVPTLEEVKEKIDNQVVHMFGPMGEATVKAVPKGDYKITNIGKAQLVARNTFSVPYTYTGTVIVQNNATGNSYNVILPKNPDLIYKQAMVLNRKPCTDHHYDSEGDFWYFWNPSNPGCRLRQGVHYDVIKSSIKRIANTNVSYPEYAKLVQNLSVPTIKVSMMMGMDDTSKGTDPLRSGDINAQNYRGIRNTLIQMGFQESRALSEAEFEQLVGHAVKTAHYVQEFVKEDKKARILVRLSFGPTGIDEDSDGFHWLMKEAMENSSIMIYDGHSGLGGHLDLASIENTEGFKFQPNKNQYQIYFFNSCSSYTYYNTMYFARKKTAQDPKGTKNLDIMTNGLATYFSVMGETNMAVVKAVDSWANDKGTMSYQTLARQIDSGNLFGINGDEDNSTRE